MRFRLGVIGLGPRWWRYRHALAALGGEVRVVALHDPSAMQAGLEAQALGCDAVGGVVELVERKDLDGVLIVGGTWPGLWAIEQVCRADLPVLCAVSPVEDQAFLLQLVDRLPAVAQVEFALWPTLGILVESAVNLLEDPLGPASLIQMQWTRSGAHSRSVLSSSATLALLAASVDLAGREPEAITVHTAGQDHFASMTVEFEEGPIAQFTLWGGPGQRSRSSVMIEAERGSLRLELPRTISWDDIEGTHQHVFPAGPAEALVLDRFVAAVREQEESSCPLSRAVTLINWLKVARRSATTGRREVIEPASS